MQFLLQQTVESAAYLLTSIFQLGELMQVVGLDFAQEMLDDAEARQLSQAYGIRKQNAKIEWVQGDAMQLPFPDCSFDAATMGYGLRNVPDVLQTLKVSCQSQGCNM